MSNSDDHREDSLPGSDQQKPSEEPRISSAAEDVFDRVARRRCAANRLFIANFGVDSDRTESARILRNMEWQEISLPSDATREHPTYRALLAHYDAHLVPDDAFYHMLQNQDAEFRESIHQGGMLNRSTPTSKELEKYPLDYEPVAEQMFTDLTRRSSRPGRYCMAGLKSPGSDEFTATLSYRLPPAERDEVAQRAYRTYLEKMFEEVSFRGITQEQMNQIFGSMMEIDTVISAVRGGGTKLIADTLSRIEEQEGKRTPEYVFCYRFCWLSPLEPKIQGEKRRKIFGGGENTSSAEMFGHCGFDGIGFLKKEKEVVVRDVPNCGLVVLQPIWEFALARFETAKQRAQSRLQKILKESEADGVSDEKKKS